jgi:uncharacterized NAD(P)/FAD-binding protein YdhS
MAQEQLPVVVAIIGMGVRGVGVLERLVAHSLQDPGRNRLEVHLIDPRTTGPDQYDVTQPDYLLLNIVASQVSIFPAPMSVGAAAPIDGPSLHLWACERGLKLAPDLLRLSTEGRLIEEEDFLPRRLMGEYLLWSRDRLAALAPPWMTIVNHTTAATSLESGPRLTALLLDEENLAADFAVLTVGAFPDPQCDDESEPGLVDRAFPLPKQVEEIPPGATVAVAGLGLTMVDVVLALTVGRGGTFALEGGQPHYRPSGREPRLLAFSRTGLPYRSRPSLGAPLRYEPVLFTKTRIKELREAKGQLDFDADVLPLMLGEFRIAYRRAQIGAQQGWEDADTFIETLRRSSPGETTERFVSPPADKEAPFFDALEAYSGLDAAWDQALETSESYQAWICSFIETDLAQAIVGVQASPLKAALESFREFRDVIREAVDYGGLTKSSLEHFYRVHAPALNRIGVGPQKERASELLALIRAGILTFPFGPNPRIDRSADGRWHLQSTGLARPHQETADWFCRAAISRMPPLDRTQCLVGSLARRGMARPLIPGSRFVHGLETDSENRPIGVDGRPQQRIWLLGPPEEGSTFYTGFLPSPGKRDRSVFDADRAVAAIFRMISRTSEAQPAP